jgi:SAM-dependent methyltransferase
MKAMLSRQIPTSASTVLELYPTDGKHFFYYPQTISQIFTVLDDNARDKKTEDILVSSSMRANKMLTILSFDSMVSNSVDAIVCVQSLRKAQSNGILRNLHRVLRPGGRLIFVEPLPEILALEETGFINAVYDEEVTAK